MKMFLPAIIAVFLGVPLGGLFALIFGQKFEFLENYGLEIVGHGFPSNGFLVTSIIFMTISIFCITRIISK